MRSSHSLLRTLVLVGAVVALTLAAQSLSAQGGKEPFPRDSVRAWVARYHPEIAAGDTTHNLVGFSVDQSGNVVSTAVGNDPRLNDQLALIRETRERLRAGDREGAAVVKIRGQSYLAESDTPRTPTGQILAQLNADDKSIQMAEVASHEAGEVAPVPLKVMIIRLRP